MRFLSITPAVLATILLSACDLWPRNLEALAVSISRQVSGEATVWLVGGDVVVIDVASSPSYQAPQSALEAIATDLADQTIMSSSAPLESIVITFHEGKVSEDPDRMREFIFLVMEGRPVLQPYLDVDANGPLTLAEVQTLFTEKLGESLTSEQKACFLAEVEKLAHAAGDPEALDPARVDFLPGESWDDLDAFGKRLILAQAITTNALFTCAQNPLGGGNS